ncbi:FHA domain-containing protein [Leucobacter zeae]|nr:FHA domain-containing protein [Leucobacter zeae]
MKVLVTLALPDGATHDVALSCDVTATVADAARALVRAGVSGDPGVEEAARSRSEPLTLLGQPVAGAPPVLLDPAAPIGASGLQSGWIVEPVLEFGTHGVARRMIGVIGYVEVLTGHHAGAFYSLVPGENLIGRDPACRVSLHDGSVSRRHAVLRAGSGLELRDLASANGVLVDGEPVAALRIGSPVTVVLGEVRLRIIPGPPAGAAHDLSHRIMHTRAPRVSPRFAASERELPMPPTPAKPSRIPVLALLAPMVMGGALYAVTQSPMTLMMVVFSPLMMVGAWADGTIGGRRKLRGELERFAADVRIERAELLDLREREIEVRSSETPTLAEVTRAIAERDSLLWARRPEHRSFLEVRFGVGALPSRTAVMLPHRGDTVREQWDVLRGIAAEFKEVDPVPVLERFDRCGSIGVAGPRMWAGGMARSLVLQLVGLHSPAELALACFASPDHAEEWSWLKWLPHVDAVTSPLPVWQLAEDEPGSLRLLIALEGLVEARRASAGSRSSVRSHLDMDTRNDDAQGEAVRDLPVIPTVLILVLDDACMERSRLIAIAEAGPDLGIHFIWVGGARAELPAACRTFVELGEGDGRVGFVRTATSVPLQRWEFVGAPEALGLARRLSAVEDSGARVLDESDLPRAVHLRDLHSTDLLGAAPPVARSWADSGSLVSHWSRGEERDPLALAAVVGQGTEGPMVVDLRTHGPHALVGGTSGAGKSEFLQTWIMSLATRISPDRLTFLLVDYKGGAAFAECTGLPHTVGLVTDLSPHLVRRALTSLRAELRYREELLAAHGAKDLITMERRSDPAAPPVLVIVIDEFAALANEVPEFVDGVIDIAQRGRSLGLHLIMATQRPAGVITDNLRANTNLRVALRMADESDSADVIGVTDAAFFDAETPGRGAIKAGPGRIEHFQSGYLGGRAGNADVESRIEVRSLGFAEGEPWNILPEQTGSARRRAKPPRDIERLRDGIVAAARLSGIREPRRPWLDELPRVLDLRDLTEIEACSGVRAGTGDAVTIGLRDDPAAQAQLPVAIDFEAAGNVSFIGAGGTGKTSALITLAASLCLGADARPVQLYAIDAAGGALDAISALPTVGAVASLSDLELVRRILRHLLDVIAERGPRFASARAGGLSAYRATPEHHREPRIVLLLDGFGAFRQATEALGSTESPFRMLHEVMTAGRAVGVHVALTSDRASAFPAALAASLQRQVVLRLAAPHDYGYLGVKSDALADAGPGRAVLAGELDEIQIALLGGRPDLAGQAAAIEELALALRQRGVAAAVEVRNAPDRIPLAGIAVEVDGRAAFGIDTRTLAPAGLPASGLAVVSGPPGSGQSTAVRACVAAMRRWAAARGEAVEAALLTLSPDGLRSASDWDRTALGEDEVRGLGAAFVRAIGGPPVEPARGVPGGVGGPIGGPPGIATPGTATPPPEPIVFPSPGARGIIVVERPADAEGTAALPVLIALAKAARRSDVLVIFEFEQGAAGGIWDLFNALKQPRWGLALQPDDSESQTPFRESFGRVKRADFPRGRGFAVESGRVAPVHVALPDEPERDRACARIDRGGVLWTTGPQCGPHI